MSAADGSATPTRPRWAPASAARAATGGAAGRRHPRSPRCATVELFAWEVTYIGQPVARWEYRLEPVDDGVRLIEAVHDRRGRLLRTVSPLITGSPDRDKRNADTMESTLEAIKAAAEAPPR